jgi:hypothetical protein
MCQVGLLMGMRARARAYAVLMSLAMDIMNEEG